MAQRIGGTAFCKVDGNMLPLRGNFTVSPSSLERTFMAGQDYVHGYQELPRVPWIEGDISSTPDVSMEALEQMTDVTVTAELANGKVYVLKEAACKSALENNTREGQFRVKWEGTTCEEIG
jgi:uncharacterized protein YlzI (FlbEa/FlbD family)